MAAMTSTNFVSSGRARKLGFSMTEIAALLGLWRDKDRLSREVKGLAARHLAELERRIAEMQGMAETLRRLVRSCRGDDRPECPTWLTSAARLAEPILVRLDQGQLS
jgi:DNA-binding transcriptional MerR regulator